MPRIIPEQLLNCLKVLLDKNGGILSVSEVKRLAGLMTKYSKKLVSKCIYVLILKNTKTELLGEFMAAGGWSLVYTWLNDAIRAMNWPLVQEILELLLLCPVDVNRLKINASPKLVKGLCKDGGTEGVRILARCLVDQWLKIVTENTAAMQAKSPHSTISPTSLQNLINSASQVGISTKATKQTVEKAKESIDIKEQDPLAGVDNNAENTTSYKLTPAQRKASEKGLVFKIVVKDGQQTLSKVPNSTKIAVIHPVVKNEPKILIEGDEINADDLIEEDTFETNEESENLEKSETNADNVEKSEKIVIQKDKINQLKNKSSPSSSTTSSKSKKERSNSIDMHDKKENKDDKEKLKEKDKDKKRKSSSSQVSSRKSTELGSSTKSKTSSSSSSLHSKSSKEKHRSSSKSSSSKKDKKEGEENNKHRSSSSSSKPSSSSSSSKSRSRDSDKEKERSSSLTSITNQKKIKEPSTGDIPGDSLKGKTVDTLPKMLPSISKLGRIPKKIPAAINQNENNLGNKATSIVIPSKKASISIEVRRDTEKGGTVKTYKSQFRSHGLTEEAPPPPSRKSLKKPLAASSSGTAIATTLTPALKRPSPPPHDPIVDSKKSKIDLTSIPVASDKPGAIKLIPAKKITTLIETNIFSDALLAATGPKKNVKRKRSSDGKSKDAPLSPPTSPDAGKPTALKFYQDTLEEAKAEDKSTVNTQNESDDKKTNDNKPSNNIGENKLTEKEKDNSFEDDDIPLKRVKEDIDNQLQSVKEKNDLENIDKAIDDEETAQAEKEEKKPGPGCGPDGPPGVLLLHRRKGPKKKLTWRPQEHLEQIRYFELDETERVNVTKTSFLDMKNMERFKERDAINIARRGVINEDNMEPQTTWRPLIEVEDVPAHPNGNLSKQRKIQADREMTTLRALYFATEMIPDAPVEADLEPHSAHDVPIIPLEDLTGNPDAVNDYTDMPWPEPKGSPKHGENNHSGTGGLVAIGGHGELFPNSLPTGNESPFNAVGNSYVTPGITNPLTHMPMSQNSNIGAGLNNWPIPMGPFGPNNQIVNNNNNNNSYNPHMVNPQNVGGPPVQNFVPFGPGNGIQYGNNNGQQFGQGGFNGPNFRPMGPGPIGNGHMNNNPAMMNGPMGNMGMLNGPMGNGPMMNNGIGPRNNIRNNWRNNNFDCGNNGGNGGGGGAWRSAGSGPNRGNMGNNGICKAFMRGHCRIGKSCKFIHPQKSKRI